MTSYGYHASHEQHSPSALLRLVRAAERAGFQGAMSADHFHPWLEENAQSGFAWSWLGSALEATSMSFGVVNAPGDRYHPAVIAQAAATLAEMYPGRFWVALGSGEAVNEHITGNAWPSKDERKARLLECVDVMRALWAGETVTHRGLIVVDEARLYSRPDKPPRVIGAAVSEETAEWVGGWADGLITTGRDRKGMQSIIEAFHRGGGEGKDILVQHVLSWAPGLEEARAAAHAQWRFAALESPELLWNLRMPADFAEATRHLSPDVVMKKIPTSANLEEHVEHLRMYSEVGVSEVYCHNVHRDHERFIQAFGESVLPALKQA